MHKLLSGSPDTTVGYNVDTSARQNEILMVAN